MSTVDIYQKRKGLEITMNIMQYIFFWQFLMLQNNQKIPSGESFLGFCGWHRS